MKTISGKDFAKLLEKNGNKPLKLVLLRHFMKVAGIDENEL